jgi:hypothetical protein
MEFQHGEFGYNTHMTSQTYPLFTAFGASLGLAWAWWIVYSNNPHRYSTRRQEAYLEFLLVGGLAALAGGLMGGRLGYVFLNWSYYVNHTPEIIRLQAGGLEWGGGVFGAAIFVMLVCGLYDQMPQPLLSDLLPFFAILVVVLWLAAGSASVYYGPEHARSWWTVASLDQLGETKPRIPINLLAAIFTAAAGLWLDQSCPRVLAPYRFEIFAGLEMFLLLLLSFFRADPVAPIAGMPGDRVFAIAYLAVILALLIWKVLRRRNRVTII